LTVEPGIAVAPGSEGGDSEREPGLATQLGEQSAIEAPLGGARVVIDLERLEMLL